MNQIFLRLALLCAAAAVMQLLVGDARLQDGVRFVLGLLAAGLILQAVCSVPGALLS